MKLGLECLAFFWSAACSRAPKTLRAWGGKAAAPGAGAGKVTRGKAPSRAAREAQKVLARAIFSDLGIN